MKKLLLLLTMFTLGVSAMAQNDKSKKAKKEKQEKKYKKRGNDDRENDGRYEDNRNDNDDNNNGKNNGNNNAPSKVREAFNRDYPSAQNVTWTKNRGVWTASFRRSGLFGGTRSVSYEANGTRSSSGSRTNNRQRDGRDND